LGQSSFYAVQVDYLCGKGGLHLTDPFDRVRHNYDDLNIEFADYYGLGSDGVHYTYRGPSTSYPSVCFIADETIGHRDPYWRKGRFPSGNCYQITTDYSHVGYMQDFSTDTGSVHFESGQRSILPVLFFNDISGYEPDILTNLGLRVPTSVRDNYTEQAFNYFSDVFPQSLSFGEFVQGFTQLKDLLPQLGESITKTISGGYLNKKFGWDNLLADLGTLGTLFKSTIARMEYFHRTYGVPTRLGFSRHVNSDYILDRDIHWKVHFGLYDLYTTGFSLKSANIIFRSTCWIYQVLDYVHDLVGFMRTLFGALGLNNPVKAFWNTIPLSFLVDWFFNISQHLDHLTRLNPAVGWNVNNMTYSFTYDIVYEVFQTSQYRSPSDTVKFATYEVRQQIYERNVGLSFAWELLNPDELSTSQLSLLLAMLHQLG